MFEGTSWGESTGNCCNNDSSVFQFRCQIKWFWVTSFQNFRVLIIIGDVFCLNISGELLACHVKMLELVLAKGKNREKVCNTILKKKGRTKLYLYLSEFKPPQTVKQ